MKKTEIKFGTDGFRGIIAKEFTFETVENILNAISYYLKSLNSNKNTLIIGYDPRFMAADFADFAKEFMLNQGFNIILSNKVVPTPIVAYCAKYCPDSMGAIMFTASHNPKEYQGIKFIPNYGGPADKTITDEILKYIDYPIKKYDKGNLTVKNLEEEYFNHIENIIDFKTIKNNPPKIIYDGLFSSSVGYFDTILKRNGIPFESYNMFHSSDFGGGLPEPKEKFMKYAVAGYITVANDGDADRYGVIDEQGKYVSPNIILAILLKYLVQKGKKGKMIKTVGVSSIVDIIADKLNIETITTPVGFKWLSSEMRKNDTILAGEDSGGLSIGGHIPEKDGIFANLLIIEAVSALNKPLYKLAEEIKEFANMEFYQDRVDVKLKNKDEAEKLEEKFNSFSKIANYPIIEKLMIDGKKLYLDNKYNWILIRKSGTEPLLRFYIEADNIEKLNEIKDFINKNISF